MNGGSGTTDQNGNLFLPFGEKRTITEAWRCFHQEHPEVYEELVSRARESKRAGYRCGIRMIWERMRWHFFVERGESEEEYKLNNNYTSRYARMIDESEADLKGFFELRELRSE